MGPRLSERASPATPTISRPMTIRIFPTPRALAEAAADEVAEWVGEHRSRPTIGLAGGSTPRLAYELLRLKPVPWEGVHAWMTDERHVPGDHPDSNAGMARRALFAGVPATLHEVGWIADPEAAAAAYEAELAEVLPRDPSGRLEPGLVILGIGEDGHTASLFPGSSAMDSTTDDFVATFVEGKGWRLTATRGLLARARRTLFLVTGAAKASVVAEVLSGSSDLPAALVAGASRHPVWLLDRAAASLLDA